MNSGITPRVMVVDDDEVSRCILGGMVENLGYEAWTFGSAKEAFGKMEKELPDLILSDVSMPVMDGYKFCELLKEEIRTRDIPFMFVTAMDSAEEKIKALKLGAVDYITKPYVKEEVKVRLQTHLKLYLMQHELEEYTHKLNRLVTKQMKTIESAKKTALIALAKASEGNKKITTENHLENVAYNARLIAQSLAFTDKYEGKISEQFIEQIEICSTIHDIGKVAISPNILMKNGKLTEEELKEVRMHPVFGAEIFDEVFQDMEEDEFMIMGRNTVLYHHEQYDGKGYPCGLKGDEIPLEARIVTIVDVYDTLRSERCYKPAYSLEEAKERMETVYAGHFDPDILKVFWKVERQLKKG